MASGEPVAPVHVQPVEVRWADESGVSVETAPRKVKFVRVSLDELEDLKSSGSSVELAMFGVCFGALLTFGGTLLTVSLTNDLTRGFFGLATIMFAVFSIYFGIGAIRGERRWRSRIDRLTKGEKA